MNTKIKAGAKIKEGYGNFSVIEIEKPDLNDENDVLFRVTSVGLCGTDTSIYKWTETVAKEYHPQFPLVLGHEMSGIVEKVGANVTKVKVGDHITVNEHIHCGKCEYCLEGRTCICEKRYVLGCHVNGALTEYMVVRQENCFKLPENVPYYAGSIAEPLSVALHCVECVPAQKGNIAVVFGVGTIGLGVCLILIESGINVIAVGLESDAKRLAVAEEFGAIPVVIGPDNNQGILDTIHKLGKKWADVAYECSGAASALISALEVIRPGGTVCEVGIPPKEIPINVAEHFAFKEKKLVGARAFYHSTWDKTIKLLEKSAEKAEKLITHRLPLERFEDAIHLIMSGECIKVVVCPSLEHEQRQDIGL